MYIIVVSCEAAAIIENDAGGELLQVSRITVLASLSSF